jgi:cell division protein FtsI/penicillin-binding protein 2
MRNFRKILIFFLFIIFSFVIINRLFDLQIRQGENFYIIGKKIRESRKHIKSKRGNIYDRNGRLLACDLTLYSVVAEPFKIENKKEIAQKLSEILKVDEKEILYKLYTKRFFSYIKRKVPDELVRKVKKLNIKGIYFLPESKRFYPNGEIASHILGFCGTDMNGLGGVEFFYDKYLKGEDGYFKGEFDARGSKKGLPIPISELREEKHPVNGCDIFLTIDMDLQRIAEREAEKAYNELKAKSVTILIMNPKTGEILASANKPSFDSNNFNNFKEEMWRNPIVSKVYEPGSVFKVFLISTGLEEGIIKRNSKFYCGGELKIHNTVLHDAEEREKHGFLEIPYILAHSCNICAAQIGLKIGKEKLSNYLKNFGFGDKTGIDLPGEEKGIFKPQMWGEVDLSRISFGHSVSVTPIQLLSAISCIANDGILMKPYIVKEIRNFQTKTLKKFSPEIVRKVITKKTADEITSYMVKVVKEGTGKLAKIDGYTVAGKTGTSQKSLGKLGYQKKYISSFAGFVPAESPKISILIIVDEPKGEYLAGKVAAPIFKNVAEECLFILRGGR